MPSNQEENFPIFPLLSLTTECPATPEPLTKMPILPQIKSNTVPVLNVEKRGSSGMSEATISRESRSRSKSSALQSSALQSSVLQTLVSVSEEKARFYTPVSFDIVAPDKLPYMGSDYRQVGRVKRITTETSAMKKNEVQQCRLEKLKYSLSRRKVKTEKDYLRTLLLWHIESERDSNHKDQALERRTSRILKFIDKMSSMSEGFHFTEGFFNDLSDPAYDPDPTPLPVRPNAKRPLISRKSKPTTQQSFRRVDPKEEALKARFADCIRAGEVSGSGYTYVKIYTDPYYRYLPPLSAASKKFDVKVARLPHKQLRDEDQWKRFLESLKPKPPTPVKSKQQQPDFGEINRLRTDELKRRLPMISLLPKWLLEVRDKNDYRTDRYKHRTDTYEYDQDYLGYNSESTQTKISSNSKTKRAHFAKESTLKKKKENSHEKPVSVKDVTVSPVVKVKHRVHGVLASR